MLPAYFRALSCGAGRHDHLAAHVSRPCPKQLAGFCRRRQVHCEAAAGPQQTTLAAPCMEDAYDLCVQRVLEQAAALEGSAKKLIVGVAGAPGSGKSTLAAAVVRRLEATQGPGFAAVLPMDGFHYFRRQLDSMPDPAEAHARRGAPWTFDAAGFVACVRQLRELGACVAPSFDHGTGDPVEGGVRIDPGHRVVVAEGNYLLLDEEPWAQLRSIFDESWFIDCDLDAAMQRIYRRQTGNGQAPEVSLGRIATNDRPNAELVDTSKARADLIVPSLPFCRTQ